MMKYRYSGFLCQQIRQTIQRILDYDKDNGIY
jgi:hypothetical protein